MRKHKVSKYPVGATWEARDWHGHSVTIRLAEITPTMEIWRWSSDVPNAYHWQGDWSTSYNGCKQDAPTLLDENDRPVRYKRIA